MTASLSDGLRPAEHHHVRPRRVGGELVQHPISAITRSPAACGSSPGTSYTLACLRCSAPNPSPTYASASPASLPANPPRSASSLLVSAGSKRTFSSSAT